MKAFAVLKVENFQETLRLLREHFRFKVDQLDESQELATLISPDQEKWNFNIYLLVTDQTEDYSPYVDERYSLLQPGSKIYCETPNLPSFHQSLKDELGEIVGVLNSTEWGSYDSLVQLPGGYVLELWENDDWSDEELLSYYTSLPDRLESALENLTEAELNLSRAEGKWSIKQNAIHLIDSHGSVPVRIKFALSESGRTWVGNVYSGDVWSRSLDYENRDVNPEVKHFSASIELVSSLIEHFSHSLDHYIMINDSKTTVRDMLRIVTFHSLGHIQRIHETREIHSLLPAK